MRTACGSGRGGGRVAGSLPRCRSPRQTALGCPPTQSEASTPCWCRPPVPPRSAPSTSGTAPVITISTSGTAPVITVSTSGTAPVITISTSGTAPVITISTSGTAPVITISTSGTAPVITVSLCASA